MFNTHLIANKKINKSYNLPYYINIFLTELDKCSVFLELVTVQLYKSFFMKRVDERVGRGKVE